MILTPSTCPKCGDQLSTPIRSSKWPNVYTQTCRNVQCLHTERTTVTVAPEPRPRPVSLPLPADDPQPKPAPRSAIDQFERAYKAGNSRAAIRRASRQARSVSRGDGQLKR